MESSVDFCYVFCMWITFCIQKWTHQPHHQEIMEFLGVFFILLRNNQAAFCIAIFFRWYL